MAAIVFMFDVTTRDGAGGNFSFATLPDYNICTKNLA
jgi:hypothetical protein